MSDQPLVTTSTGRLARTATFRDGGWHRWCEAKLHVIGAGNLGQRFVSEAALSGAHVTVYDPGRFGTETAYTQFGRPGALKVAELVERCEPFAPGRTIGVAQDIRHVGVGRFAQASLLIDCSDDPSLAVPLTRLSNGLGVPLLRAALAGNGQQEFGRVACSHGGAGHSCQLCTYDAAALLRRTRRAPCAGPPTPDRPPTLAGGAVGMTIAGVALLQAQRLVVGHDTELVFDREWLLDLDQGQLLPLRRARADSCLSGHVRWNVTPCARRANDLTLRALFSLAAEQFETTDLSLLSLEPYGHPLCREAFCDCGAVVASVGTRWSSPPSCVRCGATTFWNLATALDRVTCHDIERLQIADVPLGRLGFPADGPMFVARSPKRKPIRFVLQA